MEYKQQFPIYQQVRDFIRNRVESGEFKPGTYLPTVVDLAKEYGVSLITIRSAIDGLQKEGLLKIKQGKGILVNGARVERDLDNWTGFTQTMKDLNITPKINVLNNTIRYAGPEYGNMFSIPNDSYLNYIRRVCYAGSDPMSFEEIYVPFDVLPNLQELDKSEFSMYDLYDFYNIELSYIKQTLEIVQLKKNEAGLLNIPVDQSVFLFKNWTYSKGRLIEYAETNVRSDLCSYSVHFGK